MRASPQKKSGNVINVVAGDINIPLRVIGNRRPEQSVFFLGIAKSGSTLLHMMIEDVCGTLGARLINIGDSCFAAGVPERRIPEEVVPGIVETEVSYYYGFRCIGTLTKSQSFRKNNKIMLIRDPRDAMTSLYFSMKSSHSVPEEGKTAEIITSQRGIASNSTINEFILSGNGDFILNSFREVEAMGWLPNFHVYRYEDIIFEKTRWLRDVNQVAALGLPEADIVRISEKHDIRPSAENPVEHIRQVSPGNFRAHLSEEAIAYIDGKCEKALKAFGYQ